MLAGYGEAGSPKTPPSDGEATRIGSDPWCSKKIAVLSLRLDVRKTQKLGKKWG
jgi:hypothetical protein